MQIKHVCLSGMRRGDGGSRARELSAGKGLPRRDSTVVRSMQHVARMPLPERTRGQENDQQPTIVPMMTLPGAQTAARRAMNEAITLSDQQVANLDLGK
jgi:hypothetical protein